MKQIRAMMIGGHHELSAEQIAKRRRKESMAVAEYAWRNTI